MILAAITAFFQAISGVASVATPLVQDHLAHEYEQQHRDRLDQFNAIAALPDSPLRRGKLDGYVRDLCSAAGYPAGLVGGTTVTVPVECFNALVAAASDCILARDTLNAATQALTTKGNQGP